MAILSTDLKAYGAASRPEDDASTTGGAIDTLNRPVFTQLTANAVIAFQSSAAGDTQSVSVTGRDASGAVVTDTFNLTGVTEKAGTVTFKTVQKVVIASNAVGTITMKQGAAGATMATIPIGERGVFAMFLNSASDVAIVDRYEKFFWKNGNATLTLNSAIIKLTADPSAKIFMGLCVAKDDSTTVANRKAVPAGVTFVDDSVDQNVPGTTLAPASAIGVWAKQTLAANDAPLTSTFTTQLRGTSTN